MKYSGIDLHSNNSVVVVSDQADRVLVRRRVPNDAAGILPLLAGHEDHEVACDLSRRFHGRSTAVSPTSWSRNYLVITA